jgi:hypothetical protein
MSSSYLWLYLQGRKLALRVCLACNLAVTVAGVIHEHACRPPMRRPYAVQRVVAAIYDYLIGPNSCVGRG